MWRVYENSVVEKRRENCNHVLSTLLGKSELPREELPRIALCVGGVPGFVTCVSSVAFLDALATPFYTPTMPHQSSGGLKLLDTFTHVAASSSAAWTCASIIAGGVESNYFHDTVGTDLLNEVKDSTTLPSVLHVDGMDAESANTNTFIADEMKHIMTSVQADGALHTYHAPQGANPWVYGPFHFFSAEDHLAKGLAQRLCQPHLSWCSQQQSLDAKAQITILTMVGKCFGVPMALANPSLGESTLSRWCTFLSRVFLKPSYAKQMQQKVQFDDTSDRFSVAPLNDGISQRPIVEGSLPFFLFLASAVGEADSMESHSGVVEMTPFFLRTYADRQRTDSSMSRSGADQNSKELYLCEQVVPTLYTESNATVEMGIENVSESLKEQSRNSSSNSRSTKLVPLCWQHILGICGSYIASSDLHHERSALAYTCSEARKVMAARKSTAQDPEQRVSGTSSTKLKNDPELLAELQLCPAHRYCGAAPIFYAESAVGGGSLDTVARCSSSQTPPPPPPPPPMTLFGYARDLSFVESVPLAALLYESSGRAFDIIVVHDTAPYTFPSRKRCATALAQCMERGLWEPASGERSPSDFYGDQEYAHLFRGSARHPSVLYYIGPRATRLLEASYDAATIQKLTRTVHQQVREQLAPLFVSEIRRTRYMKRNSFSMLSYAQERLFQPVSVRYTQSLGSHLHFRNMSLDDQVLVKLFLGARATEDAPGQRNDAQLFTDASTLGLLAFINIGLKGFTKQIGSVLESFVDVEKKVGDFLPDDRLGIAYDHLQSRALDILCTDNQFPFAVQEVLPPEVFPSMYASPEIFEMSFKILQERVFVLLNSEGKSMASSGPSITTQPRLRNTRSSSGDNSPAWKVIYNLTLSNVNVSHFGATALLSVFRPHSDLINRKKTRQTASIGDLTRVRWLEQQEGSLLLLLLLDGAHLLNVAEEVMEELARTFADTLEKRLLQLLQERKESVETERDKKMNESKRAMQMLWIGFFDSFAEALQYLLVKLPSPSTVARVKRMLANMYKALERIQVSTDYVAQNISFTGGQLFLVRMTESAARITLTTDLLSLLLEFSACLPWAVTAQSSGMARVSPHWTYFCFCAAEGVLANPIRSQQSNFQLLLSRFFHVPVHIVECANCIPTSPRPPSPEKEKAAQCHRQGRVVLDNPAANEVSARDMYRYILPTLLSYVIPLTRDDVEGVTTILASYPRMAIDPERKERATYRAFQAFFLHGCQSRSFFSFLVQTCLERKIFLPFLNPAILTLTVPRFSASPAAAEAMLQKAMQCRNLRELKLEEEPSASSAHGRHVSLLAAPNPAPSIDLEGDNFSRGYITYERKKTVEDMVRTLPCKQLGSDDERLVLVEEKEWIPLHLAILYYKVKAHTEANRHERETGLFLSTV